MIAPTKRLTKICLLAFSLSCLPLGIKAAPCPQAGQPPDEPVQQQHDDGHGMGMGMGMGMNTPSGASTKCDPKFTYTDGPRGPSQWEGVCRTGRMQAPIDITTAQKVPVPPLPPLEFSYQPADLDVVNDCGDYQIKVRFPENQWLKVARKPYRLSEIVFHEPGENAVNGRRPPMSLQLVHLSPESTFLVIEVPIVVGKENPVIKAIWNHIPAAGKEHVAEGVKINAMDLLPADHGFFRFPGSLTIPICNEGVMWFLMKNPIEMSEAQMAQYRRYYHDAARPLQPLNNRPVFESQ